MDMQERQRRLLFILHRGLVEARLLAQGKKIEQLFDLADALEIIPGHANRWDDRSLEVVRFSLKKYRDKYPSPSFDYLRYFDVDPVPEHF
jgi:hypothetical protein